MINNHTVSLRPVSDLHSGQGSQPKRFAHPRVISAFTLHGKTSHDIRLIVLSACILRLRMRKLRTMHGHYTRSVKGVIKTQVFDVREFLQPENNGIECDQK